MSVSVKERRAFTFNLYNNIDVNLLIINARHACMLCTESYRIESHRIIWNLVEGLEFDRDEEGVTADLGRSVGYNLGGRLLSLADVADVVVSKVAPFSLGRDMPR